MIRRTLIDIAWLCAAAACGALMALFMPGGSPLWARGLASGKILHKLIDADPDPSHGELIEIRLEGLPRPGRFLKAECPRNGTIVEGVPPEINSVLAAQAWRVGLEPHEFSYPSYRT